MSSPVLAAYAWPTNADLIVDVAALGYLHSDWITLDCTYGRGRWWTKWQPRKLIKHDLRLDGVDFRKLPEDDKSIDVVAYDAPYVSVGGRSTSTLGDMNDAYGLHTTPSSPQGLQEMIDDGLAEIARVCRGLVLCKIADYVSGGKLFPGTFYTLEAAYNLGYTLEDRFEHIGRPRPQPKRTRADGKPSVQQHARRNLSTLLVLKAPKR